MNEIKRMQQLAGLNEIKINAPIKVDILNQNQGYIIINNSQKIPYVIGNEYGLLSFTHIDDLYKYYNVDIENAAEEMGYHEVSNEVSEEEMVELGEKLIKDLSIFNPKLINDGEEEIHIKLDKEKIMKFHNTNDLPKYIGDGEFEYKGHTFKYVTNNKDDLSTTFRNFADGKHYNPIGYDIYIDGKLFTQKTTQVSDFKYFISYLKSKGKEDNTGISPYMLYNRFIK